MDAVPSPKAPEALLPSQTHQPEEITVAETLPRSVGGSDAVAAAVAVTVAASRNRNRLGSANRTRKTEADAKTDDKPICAIYPSQGYAKTWIKSIA